MRILQDYRLISGKEMADYIMKVDVRVSKDLTKNWTNCTDSPNEMQVSHSKQSSIRSKTSVATTKQLQQDQNELKPWHQKAAFTFPSEESINFALKRRQIESQQTLATVRATSAFSKSSFNETMFHHSKAAHAQSSLGRNKNRNGRSNSRANFGQNKRSTYAASNFSEYVSIIQYFCTL